MIDITTFPAKDCDWTEDHWRDLLLFLKESGIVSYKDMASGILGLLNPPQVGTQVASKTGFKKHYGKGKTMQQVYKWLYEREGTCVDCGTRLELQADHIIPKESYDNPEDADYLENLDLRCIGLLDCIFTKRSLLSLCSKFFLSSIVYRIRANFIYKQ